MKEEKSLFVPIAIVIAGVLIVAGIYFSSSGSLTLRAPETSQKQPTKEESLKGAITLGDPNAPVVIIEYADYQCPFCGRFFKETRPLIIEAYVKSGKVLLGYKDFAFLGKESTDAAEAARCAHDQGKFWQYHDAIFNYLWDNYHSKEKNGENVGALSTERLKTFAAELNIDRSAFAQCLDGGTHVQDVKAQLEEGKAFGVSGTPAFLVNGMLVSGALPFDQFKKIIDEALK